jgi:hypothetical protein
MQASQGISGLPMEMKPVWACTMLGARRVADKQATSQKIERGGDK